MKIIDIIDINNTSLVELSEADANFVILNYHLVYYLIFRPFIEFYDNFIKHIFGPK